LFQTLDQHLKHNIIPAKTRKDLYKQYMDEMERRQKQQDNETAQKLEKVKSMWKSLVEWWKRTDWDTKPKPVMKKSKQAPPPNVCLMSAPPPACEPMREFEERRVMPRERPMREMACKKEAKPRDTGSTEAPSAAIVLKVVIIL
jgi:hypothetical protein